MKAEFLRVNTCFGAGQGLASFSGSLIRQFRSLRRIMVVHHPHKRFLLASLVDPEQHD